MKSRSNSATLVRRGLAVIVAASSLPFATAYAIDIDACENEDLPFHEAEECSKLVSAQSKNALDLGRIFTLRGYAWMRENEPAGALSDFTRAINLDQGNISALRGRARAYTALKRYEESIADWTRLISVRPQGEEYYRERALAYLENGNAKEAFADYDKAIEIKARNPDSYIGRAQIYQRMNMREAALREFDKAAAADPSYPNTYFAKAQAAEKWGDKELAIQNYALVVRYKGDVWYAQRAMKRLGEQFSDIERHDYSTMPKSNQ